MSERKMCKFYNLNLPDRDPDHAAPAPAPLPHNNTNHSHEQDLEIPEDHHKLQSAYWFWYSQRRPTIRTYDQVLQYVGRIGSVEQWWGLYSHLARPSEVPPPTDLCLFKDGIKPMWEDDANINGGKWTVRLRKGQAGPMWEDLCMAMLGEQFTVGDELCGVVLSVRNQEDHLAVWHRTAADTHTATRIKDTLRRVLQLTSANPLLYKVHKEHFNNTSTAGVGGARPDTSTSSSNSTTSDSNSHS